MDTHTMPFGNKGVRLERLLPGPIERVWDYLTDSRKRATWLAAGEFELREGGRIELRFDNDSLSPGASRPEQRCSPDSGLTGHITRFDPPHALAFTWEGASDPSEVTFELAPRDGKVLLIVTHRRLVDRGTRVGVASGWDAHVSILAARLAGEMPAPFWPTHARLEREYESRLPR